VSRFANLERPEKDSKVPECEWLCEASVCERVLHEAAHVVDVFEQRVR